MAHLQKRKKPAGSTGLIPHYAIPPDFWAHPDQQSVFSDDDEPITAPPPPRVARQVICLPPRGHRQQSNRLPPAPESRDIDVQALLHSLMTPDCVRVFPWARRLARPSEAAGIVVSRLIYWGSASTKSQNSKRIQPRGRLYSDSGEQSAALSLRELSRQCRVSVAQVGKIMATLSAHGLIHVHRSPEGTRVSIDGAPLTAAYANVTGSRTAQEELRQGIKNWYESQTAREATRKASTFSPALYKLVGDRLAARVLFQVIYEYQKWPRAGWYETTLPKLARALGVEHQSLSRALSKLEAGGWLHRAVYRGARSSPVSLLCPAFSRLEEILIPAEVI